MKKLSAIIACSLIGLSASSFAQQTDMISEGDVADIQQNASPELQAQLDANPNLLPQLVQRINLAYNVAQNDSNPALTASSMVGSFISSNQYSYKMPAAEDAMDCSAQLAASVAAAQDAVTAISTYNLNHYVPGESKPVGADYTAQEILMGVLQGTMTAGMTGITADQISIGTFQVCNYNSQQALGYMTAITNLTTTIFNTLNK